MTDFSTAADDWALFLDFDGTLVDIAPRPDAVVVEPSVRHALARLSERLGGAVSIVTGRTIQDAASYLGDLPIDICGLHGLEQRLCGTVSRPPDLVPLGHEVEALRRRFADRPGILVEDKGFGLTIHWRMAPEAEEAATRAIDELAARLGPAYRIQDGKAVRELVPARAGKGEGIKAMMLSQPYAGRRPLFVGDDRTDEHGFVAVQDIGGIGIKVGPGDTAAAKRLDGPGQVREWLSGWAGGTNPMDAMMHCA